MHSIPPLDTPSERRAWAFAAIVGGCMVFTTFAAVGVYLVRDNVFYAFLLALAAHGQVLVGMTALGWVLGRRVDVQFTKDSLLIDDTKVATTHEEINP